MGKKTFSVLPTSKAVNIFDSDSSSEKKKSIVLRQYVHHQIFSKQLSLEEKI